MDSVTHIVVGAALGEMALGKKLGNKAMVMGAIANTIPDLDVFFVRLASTPDIATRIHRSYTHAIFMHPFMALPFAWLAYRVFKKKIPYFTWYLFFLLGFFTHVMMDCCTTYGTQLLLPFTDKLISWNNLSVVDPLFTLPPFLIFFVLLFMKKDNNRRRYLAASGIVLSLFYLSAATIHKFSSVKVFRKALQEQHITVTNFSTTPTMFTSWLWNMVAYNDTAMYLGEYSTFQKNDHVDIVPIQRNTELLQPIAATKQVQTLIWFSQGNYFVERGTGDTLNFYITKWGRGDFTTTDINKMFPFYNKLYTDEHHHVVSYKEVFPDFTRKDFTLYFSMLHKRIFE